MKLWRAIPNSLPWLSIVFVHELIGGVMTAMKHCRLVPGILKDHLSHLVINLLPLTDEVSRLVVCHHRRPFLLENHQNRFGASAPAISLIAGDLPECSRDAVELQGNALLDERGPLYLAARAAGFSNVCDHWLDRVLKVQTAKSID